MFLFWRRVAFYYSIIYTRKVVNHKYSLWGVFHKMSMLLQETTLFTTLEASFTQFPVTTPSVQFSHSVMSNSLRPHEPQHTRPPCPSPTPWLYPNSCPLSRWCHSTISSSVVPFSSCLQSFPASGSFQMSQLFASGGQSIGVSASTSVLRMNTLMNYPLSITVSCLLQWKGKKRKEFLFFPFLRTKKIKRTVSRPEHSLFFFFFFFTLTAPNSACL